MSIQTLKPYKILIVVQGASLLGFSFAAMVRKLLVDDPEFIFPLSLQQVTLYRSMQGSMEHNSVLAQKQMKVCVALSITTHLSRIPKNLRSMSDILEQVFWLIFLGIFVWQFLPEYMFPFVASLAPLCWFASQNHTVNFLGAGRGGIGLLNITLDWSNITSTVITYPYSVQVTVFVGFLITVSLAITESTNPVTPAFRH